MFNKLAKQQIIIKKHKARGSWLTMTMKKWIFCTKTTYLKILKAKDQLQAYPASRGYIFAVWAGVRKVASADNRSILTIVHAKNSSRDSQATGWSNLRQFCGNQNCENYLRTNLLELLFCFSALPVRKISSDRLLRKHYATTCSKSCLIWGEHI